MILWDVLFVTLAVLVVVLFFGFVGCGGDAFGVAGSDYPTTIEGTQCPGGGAALVAYWRLGDNGSLVVPAPPGGTSGGQAKSQVGPFNGDYFRLKPVTTADAARHSPVTAGTITLGISPGLLEVSTAPPSSPCIQVDGAFVRVPFDDKLNPPKFTFEAWIRPDIGNDPDGNYYCLVESTGPQGLKKRLTGFGLYFGPKDSPPKTPPGPYFWQVWMGDGTNFTQKAVSTDVAKLSGQLTYLVLTFDGSNLQMFLYFPDTSQDLDIPHLQALQANVTTFQRNDLSAKGQGDFFIGAGSNLFPVAPPPQRLYPFKGKIQEVALYNCDLSAPNNGGVSAILGVHEAAGGNF